MTNQAGNTGKQSKPFGIILTAIYFAVSGFASVLVSILLLFMTGLPLPAWVTLYGVVMLWLGVLSFATCYGLWVLIEWGRKLAIAICAISISLNLVSLKMSGQEVTSGTVVLVVVSIAIAVLIIWYLLKDDVKSLFPKTQA